MRWKSAGAWRILRKKAECTAMTSQSKFSSSNTVIILYVVMFSFLPKKRMSVNLQRKKIKNKLGIAFL